MTEEHTHTTRPPKHALILQGDWEAGLTRVAKDLQKNGTKVTKIMLEPCDLRYKLHGVPCEKFDAPLAEFSAWLRAKVKELEVDCFLLYNEYRPYNREGYRLAEELGIECIVMELGLLRPDFISIYSRNRNLFTYFKEKWESLVESGEQLEDVEPPERIRLAATSSKMRQFAFAYLFNRLFTCIFRRYRHYQDQRRMDFFHHFDAGLKGQLRFQGRVKQSGFNKIMEKKWKGQYYIVPLQVHCDSQITERSDFKSIEEFITLVVHSFAKHAPNDTKLIFKVHPMDRGYADYANFIKELNTRLDTKRLFYLDRIHNPTALKNARGCITINSSMGISALVHEIPVITLGRASFDLPELTFQGSLDEFWTDAPLPDPKHVKNFVNLLKQTSQGHGTFYKRLFAVKGESKIQWPEEFKYLFPE